MNNSFGEIIKYKRISNNWTVKQFIKILGRKLSPTYITKIEAHGHIPSPSLTITMAKALNLDPLYLLELARTAKINKLCSELGKRYNL